MQTFLPYPDFELSARFLDRQRLGKQRVEAWQILNVLEELKIPGRTPAWRNHPAVRMWQGCETALAVYCEHCCIEWARRGYKDTIRRRLWQLSGVCITPSWFGNPAFHAAHRSILLAKNPEWYGRFNWRDPVAVPNDKGSWPYVWPV